jgi:enoyl-CoA hydratase/carnithine racemase
MTETVTTERRGHVLLIGFNRPGKLNAFTPEMLRDLAEAYGELARDPDLRVGVVHATGRYFTAGLDMPSIAKQLPYELASRVTNRIPFVEPIKGMVPKGGIDPWGVNGDPSPKPIVTAVQGRCFTLGIELMLASQINVVGEEATFTQFEVSRGLFPFGGGTMRWAPVAGLNNAYRYVLTGEEFDAAEAYRMGIAQHVVPTDQVLDKAIEVAELVAKQAPLAVQAAMRNMRLAQDKGAKAALGKLFIELGKVMMTKDVRRGIKAFSERKEAVFEGN